MSGVARTPKGILHGPRIPVCGKFSEWPEIPKQGQLVLDGTSRRATVSMLILVGFPTRK